jgi:2-keto-4-pentenoate hydratase/2-oxohepta-3-ene-1,7-dioic acid hydratase in catechol pathway
MRMQLVTFRSQGGWQAGVEVDGRVVAAAALGPYPSTVKELLTLEGTRFDALLDAAAKAAKRDDALALSEVQLGPPIPDPEKIICLGLNYKDHAAEAGLKLPAAPVLFAKYRNSLIGPFDDIEVPPAAANAVDYEVELAVVIGRRASRVSEADALDYVAGYSVFNDVSARDLQMQTSQWGAGKAIDGFAPMGPGIVPARFISDPQSLMLTTRVNGERLQHESTSQMIFGIASTIAFITQFMTLEPGDVIATGTPAGVGFTRKPPIALRDGDVVELEIEKVGTIRNRVVIPSAQGRETPIGVGSSERSRP